MLSGRPPFQEVTPVETFRLLLEAEPVSPRLLQPQVDRDLETIRLKCLQKEPSRRYTKTHQEQAVETNPQNPLFRSYLAEHIRVLGELTVAEARTDAQ